MRAESVPLTLSAVAITVNLLGVRHGPPGSSAYMKMKVHRNSPMMARASCVRSAHRANEQYTWCAQTYHPALGLVRRVGGGLHIGGEHHDVRLLMARVDLPQLLIEQV